MSCGNYLELLSARLDGALAGAEERELEAHLESCPACRAAEAQLTALRSAFAGLEEIPAPEGFARQVMGRVRTPAPKQTVPLFRRPQFKALAGLAACAVLAAGLYGAVSQTRQDRDMPEERGYRRDAVLEEDGSLAVNDILRSVPDFSATAAGSDTGGPDAQTEIPFPELQKAVPDEYESASYDRADAVLASPISDAEILVVDRMPEGGWELIPPETPVSADGLHVPGELLEQIRQLAQEQGITASLTPGAEEAERHLIVVLDEAK